MRIYLLRSGPRIDHTEQNIFNCCCLRRRRNRKKLTNVKISTYLNVFFFSYDLHVFPQHMWDGRQQLNRRVLFKL